MNKFFKKALSLVLTVVMLMSFATVGLVAFAEGEATEEEHVCVFDQKVKSAEFKKSDVTATDPAVYYYSCVCGEYDENSTFEDHRMMWQIVWSFILEIYNFYKYIFYDVFLGKAP